MFKTIKRLIALFLVPCLFAEPAAAFVPNSATGLRVRSNLPASEALPFASQALAAWSIEFIDARIHGPRARWNRSIHGNDFTSNQLSAPPKAASVALIGTGAWGQVLMRNLLHILPGENLQLSIYDRKPSSGLKEALQGMPGWTTRDNLNELISDPSIRAVVIATPANTHYTLVKAALLAGKHVFVEKPLCFTAEQANELAWLAEQKRCVLLVDYTLLHDPLFLRLNEMVHEHRFGKIQRIEAELLNPLRSEGDKTAGVLSNLGTHSISLVQALLDQGTPPEVVSVHSSSDDLTAHAKLRYGSAEVTLDVSLNSEAGPHRSLKVFGEQGEAVFDFTQFPHRLIVNGREELSDPQALLPLESRLRGFLKAVQEAPESLPETRSSVAVVQTIDELNTKLVEAALPASSFPVRPAAWIESFQVYMGQFFAIVLLPVVLAVYLLFSVPIKISSPGPVLITQLRLGYRQKLIPVVKFRTKTTEENDEDRTITSIGKWLRLLGVDELPQLWSIAKGEMVWIGPRPVLPEMLSEKDSRVYDFARPGMFSTKSDEPVTPDQQDVMFKNFILDSKNNKFLYKLLLPFRTLRSNFRKERLLIRRSEEIKARRPRVAPVVPETVYNPELHVVSDNPAVCRKAYEMIREQIQAKPNSTFLMPTGETPKEFYRLLAEAARKGEIDLRQATIFMLDEYEGGTDYRDYIQHHLLDQLPAENRPGAVHVLDGKTANWENECRFYEEKIVKAGGIDLCLLGVGPDGHLAFNEQGSAFNSRTRRVKLASSTLKANGSMMNGSHTHALTVGLGTILESRRIVVIASGASKAPPIHRFLTEPPSTDLPLSAIRLHPHATVIVDHAALPGQRQMAVRLYRDADGTQRIDMSTVPKGRTKAFLEAIKNTQLQNKVFLMGGSVVNLLLGVDAGDLDWFKAADMTTEEILRFSEVIRPLGPWDDLGQVGDKEVVGIHTFSSTIMTPALSVNRMAVGFDPKHEDPYIKDYPFSGVECHGLDDLLHSRASLVGGVKLPLVRWMPIILPKMTKYRLTPTPELLKRFDGVVEQNHNFSQSEPPTAMERVAREEFAVAVRAYLEWKATAIEGTGARTTQEDFTSPDSAHTDLDSEFQKSLQVDSPWMARSEALQHEVSPSPKAQLWIQALTGRWREGEDPYAFMDAIFKYALPALAWNSNTDGELDTVRRELEWPKGNPDLPRPIELTSDDRQCIGRELRKFWRAKGLEATHGFFGPHIAAIHTFTQNPKDFFVSSERAMDLADGGTMEERLLTQAARSLEIVPHVRHFGPHILNFDTGPIDNDLLVRVVRQYISLYVAWPEEEKVKSPLSTAGYSGRQSGCSYRDWMLWMLTLMLDPTIHDLQAGIQETQDFARQLPGRKSTEEAVSNYLLAMLKNIPRVDSHGAPTGGLISDSEIESLLADILRITDRTWDERGFRSPRNFSRPPSESLPYKVVQNSPVRRYRDVVVSIAFSMIVERNTTLRIKYKNPETFYREVFLRWPPFKTQFPGLQARLSSLILAVAAVTMFFTSGWSVHRTRPSSAPAERRTA